MISLLYVDDEPALLEIGKAFLERDEEFEVDVITSAPVALDLMIPKAYDAIISDYQMPGMNGIEFLRKVRSSGNTIPFILFTGRGREEVVIQALNEGADFYLQKGGEPKSQFAELSNKVRYAVTRRRAEDALKQEEAELRQIIDLVPHMIFAKDWDGNYLLANRVVADMYDTTVAALMGKSQARFHRDETQLRRMLEDDREVISKGIPKFIPEEPYTDASGEQRFLQTTKVPFIVPGNNRRAVLGVAIDITEQKRAEAELLKKNEELNASYEQIAAAEEELRSNLDTLTQQEMALRESEEKFRGIFDMVNDAIHIHDIEPDGTPGKFIEINNVACRMLQYTRDEMLECGPLDFVTGYHSRPVGGITGELSSTGHAFFETEHRRKDGTIVPVEINTHVVTLQGKRVMLSVVRDISERIRVNEELRKSEEKFRSLVENSLEAILISDFQGNVLFTNNATHRLIETDSRNGLIGKNVMEFIAPESREDVIRDFIRVSQGQDSFLSRYHVISAQGKKISVESVGKVISYEGKPADLISLRDVTGQNLMAEALRESEARLRATLESTADGILAVDRKGKMLHASSRFAEIWHIPPALMDAGDDSAMLEFVLDQLVDPDAFLQKVWSLYDSDGVDMDTLVFRDCRVVERYSFPMMLDGERIGRVWSFRDVTERKQSERALAESEKWLGTILNTAEVGIMVVDVATHTILEANPKALSLIGAPESEVTGAICHKFVCPAEQGKCPVSDLGQVVNSSERVLITKDGYPIPIIKTVVPAELGGRKVLLESFFDISEGKKSEITMRESEERYRLLTENMKDVVWQMDATLTFSYTSPSVFQQFGYSPEEVVGKTIFDLCTPESAEELRDLLAKRWEDDPASAARKSATYFLDLVRRDGTVMNAEVFTNTVFDSGGNLAGWNGITRDITERRLAEKALVEREEKYRGLFAAESDGIVVIDRRTGLIVDCNDAFPRMYGYRTEELIGQPVTMVSAEPETSHAAILAGTRYIPIRNHKRKDGSVFPVEITANITCLQGNEVFIAAIRDITERKLAEKALSLANRKLNLLSGITRHDINNQLAVLQSYLSLLEEDGADPSRRKYFEEVTTAAGRISAMIRFAREYEQIGINAPVWQNARSVVETVAKTAPLGSVRVENDLPPAMELFADPLIASVFYNLMDNAVRYGGKITTIRFSGHDSGEGFVLVCEDNGNGIPAREKEKIFERGYGKNTGLGLALSREVLDITGIDLRETGHQGHGARFEIRVPPGVYRENIPAG